MDSSDCFERIYRSILSICALLLVCTSTPAQSQQPTRRIALIIGNSDYDRNGSVTPLADPQRGILRDIPSACEDARAFAQSLRNAQWTEEEILGGARCDLAAPQMREEFNRIVQQLSAPVEGEKILAIIYFGGHGAQFGEGRGQSQFLFGAGATFDVPRIINGIRQAPGNTGFVANEAVDLTEILSRVGHQTGNALWIITDACRNNAFYGEVHAETNLQVRAISPQDIDYSGVVVTYSTSGGEFSSAPVDRSSPFTATLSSMLRPSTRIDDILNDLPGGVDAAHRALGDLGSRRPKSDGRFNGRWCVWSCPLDALITTLAPRARASLEPKPATERLAGTLYLRASSLQGNSAVPSKFMPMRITARPAVNNAVPDRVVFDRYGEQAASAPRQRGLRVDIFWCDELAGASERAARATALADRLGTLAQGRGATAADSRFASLNFVRLRRLSSAANLQGDYRYTDDSLIVDEDSPSELGLAEALAGEGPGRLAIRRDGRTPDYVSVVYCKAADRPTVSPLLYIQVPESRWLNLGREMRRKLLRNLPSAKVPAGIEVVPQSPLETEVRFFHANDRDLAFRTAATLEAGLSGPVRVQYLPQFGPATRTGQMEVWLGTDHKIGERPPGN